MEPRWVALGVAMLLVTAIVSWLVFTERGRHDAGPGPADGIVTIEMEDFTFRPGSVRVRGDAPGLALVNRDLFLHDLAVPALDVLVRVTASSSAFVDLAGATPGTYTFYCTLHSDTRVADPDEAGMAGILVIE